MSASAELLRRLALSNGGSYFTKFPEEAWTPGPMNESVLYKNKKYSSASSALESYIWEFEDDQKPRRSHRAKDEVGALLLANAVTLQNSERLKSPHSHKQIRQHADTSGNSTIDRLARRKLTSLHESVDRSYASLQHHHQEQAEVQEALDASQKLLRQLSLDDLSSLPGNSQILRQLQDTQSIATDVLLHANPVTICESNNSSPSRREEGLRPPSQRMPAYGLTYSESDLTQTATGGRRQPSENDPTRTAHLRPLASNTSQQHSKFGNEADVIFQESFQSNQYLTPDSLKTGRKFEGYSTKTSLVDSHSLSQMSPNHHATVSKLRQFRSDVGSRDMLSQDKTLMDDTRRRANEPDERVKSSNQGYAQQASDLCRKSHNFFPAGHDPSQSRLVEVVEELEEYRESSGTNLKYRNGARHDGSRPNGHSYRSIDFIDSPDPVVRLDRKLQSLRAMLLESETGSLTFDQSLPDASLHLQDLTPPSPGRSRPRYPTRRRENIDSKSIAVGAAQRPGQTTNGSLHMPPKTLSTIHGDKNFLHSRSNPLEHIDRDKSHPSIDIDLSSSNARALMLAGKAYSTPKHDRAVSHNVAGDLSLGRRLERELEAVSSVTSGTDVLLMSPSSGRKVPSHPGNVQPVPPNVQRVQVHADAGLAHKHDKNSTSRGNTGGSTREWIDRPSIENMSNDVHREYMKSLWRDIDGSASSIVTAQTDDLAFESPLWSARIAPSSDKCKKEVTFQNPEQGHNNNHHFKESLHSIREVEQMKQGQHLRDSHDDVDVRQPDFLVKVRELLHMSPNQATGPGPIPEIRMEQPGAFPLCTPPQSPPKKMAVSPDTDVVLEGDRPWEKSVPAFKVPRPVQESSNEEMLSKQGERSTLVDQFLQECLTATDRPRSPTLTGRDQPGSMEALKNMLFAVQSMAPSSEHVLTSTGKTVGPQDIMTELSTNPSNANYHSRTTPLDNEMDEATARTGVPTFNVGNLSERNQRMVQIQIPAEKEVCDENENADVQELKRADLKRHVAPELTHLLSNSFENQPGTDSLEKAMQHLSVMRSLVQDHGSKGSL